MHRESGKIDEIVKVADPKEEYKVKVEHFKLLNEDQEPGLGSQTFSSKTRPLKYQKQNQNLEPLLDSKLPDNVITSQAKRVNSSELKAGSMENDDQQPRDGGSALIESLLMSAKIQEEKDRANID